MPGNILVPAQEVELLAFGRARDAHAIVFEFDEHVVAGRRDHGELDELTERGVLPASLAAFLHREDLARLAAVKLLVQTLGLGELAVVGIAAAADFHDHIAMNDLWRAVSSAHVEYPSVGPARHGCAAGA